MTDGEIGEPFSKAEKAAAGQQSSDFNCGTLQTKVDSVDIENEPGKLSVAGGTAATATLFGIPFSRLDMAGTCNALLQELPKGGGVRSVVTANVDHIVRLLRDEKLNAAYSRAWLRTVDGKPLYAYGQLLSLDLPHVAGADLVPMLLDRLDADRHRPFFVVANDELGEKLTNWLRERGFEAQSIDYVAPPYGFEKLGDAQERLAARVKLHRATHVFMGLGCPRSEIWADQFRNQLGDVYILSVGAALAFHVGSISRAPVMVRNLGFEWLWRVFTDPKRMFKRYFIHSWPFFAVVAKDVYSRVLGGRGFDIGNSSPATLVEHN